MKTENQGFPKFLKYHLHKNKMDRRIWVRVDSQELLDAEVKKLRADGYSPQIDHAQKELWQVKIYGRMGRTFHKIMGVNTTVEKHLINWREIGTAKRIGKIWFIQQVSLDAFRSQLRENKEDILEILKFN